MSSPAVATHSVDVGGPDCVSSLNQNYTWGATVIGGSGPFAYRWELSRNSVDWSDFGLNSPQVSLKFTSSAFDGYGYIRVNVSSDVSETIATSPPFFYRESWKRGCAL
jgi:hypothetical protein